MRNFCYSEGKNKMSFTAAAYSYDCCYSKQVCLQWEINVLIYNPWKSQKKQVKASWERECGNERNSNYREQGLSCFGMSLDWESGNGRDWNTSGRAQPWESLLSPSRGCQPGWRKGRALKDQFWSCSFKGKASALKTGMKSHV